MTRSALQNPSGGAVTSDGLFVNTNRAVETYALATAALSAGKLASVSVTLTLRSQTQMCADHGFG